MRYFVHLSYKGTRYRGWQRQLRVRTVQECIEDCFSRMLKTRVSCFGCGRTDAEVHASQYVLHFNGPDEFDYDPISRLNLMLPADISVYDMVPVRNHRNARFDAIQRKYEYYIHGYKHPTIHDISSYYPYDELDLGAMREAMLLLSEHRDYYNFCKSPDKHKHTYCCISDCSLESSNDGRHLRITISADRFLRSMVRKLVYSLIQIGRGKTTVSQFRGYLQSPDKALIIPLAHPQGLYLSKITYPYLEFQQRCPAGGLGQFFAGN